VPLDPLLQFGPPELLLLLVLLLPQVPLPRQREAEEIPVYNRYGVLFIYTSCLLPHDHLDQLTVISVMALYVQGFTAIGTALVKGER